MLQLLLDYIAVLRTLMPSIVPTDWRGLSVCHLVSPGKTAEAIEMPFM